MLIHGLQKMTLLDYPGKVACTVFLGGCDFRCPYCHNFELVDGSFAPVMDDQEFFEFLKKRQGLLDGVAVTGGEPLLRKDLPEFLEKIKDLHFLVKLDTNGFHPDELSEVISRGLVDYIAMDIKNSPDKYKMTVGVDDVDVDKISRSICLIMDSGIDYEFRTTVVKEFHEKKDFEKIGEWIKGAKAYFLQQYNQRETVPDKTLSSPSADEMETFLGAVLTNVPTAAIRGI